jgi:nicotinate-nucleotide adenylyltransferase
VIGIFGGTFDPIHFGHLRVALDVMEKLQLEQIRFIKLNQAVHRDQPRTPGVQRLEMLQAAIANQPGFIADDREIRRDSPSYTLHTLQSLRRELGRQVPLCLLLGADAYAAFLQWHKPLEIIQLAHLIIMQRPGHMLPDDPALHAFTQQHLLQQPQQLAESAAGRIMLLPVTQLEISASDIRRRARQGASARYLLPEAVWKIVVRENLYRWKGRV